MQIDDHSKFFDKWLDDATDVVVKKVGSEEKLSQQDVMVMILKLQTNHITHMETAIHAELLELRKETNTRFEEVHRRFKEAREETNKRFEEARQEAKEARQETNKRFKEAREETNMRFKEMHAESNARFEKARQEAKEASQEANTRSEKASQEANKRFEEARQEANARSEDMHRKFTFMQWLIIAGFSILGLAIAVAALVLRS